MICSAHNKKLKISGISFALRHREINSHGSFEAWGIGFHYEYDSDLKGLNIIHARSTRPLSYMSFDKKLSKSPLEFVKLLEKTTQVKALIFSNNKTVDLSETLDDARMSALLPGSALLAQQSFCFKNEALHKSEKKFCKDYSLKNFKIKRISADDSCKSFYSGTLETQRCNSIYVRVTHLHDILNYFSEKIVSDLIARETGYNLQSSAHTLLKMSYRLSVLARIIDESFIPLKKIENNLQKRLMESSKIINRNQAVNNISKVIC